MGCKRVLLMQRYDFYLSCARILRKKWGNGGDFQQLFGVGNTKWGIYKPKCVDYKPYWGMWKDGTNFVASLWTSGRRDCEVEAGFYEVWLHERWDCATFVVSMSAGRILKSPIVKRVREEKDFGTMNRKDFCGLMSFRVEFGRIVAKFGRYHWYLLNLHPKMRKKACFNVKLKNE